VKPPRISGYPPAIDPELRLPADAPERLTRIGMETHLFELIGDAWFTYPDRDKAVL
jgi:hypothetical protein